MWGTIGSSRCLSNNNIILSHLCKTLLHLFNHHIQLSHVLLAANHLINYSHNECLFCKLARSINASRRLLTSQQPVPTAELERIAQKVRSGSRCDILHGSNNDRRHAKMSSRAQHPTSTLRQSSRTRKSSSVPDPPDILTKVPILIHHPCRTPSSHPSCLPHPRTQKATQHILNNTNTP